MAHMQVEKSFTNRLGSPASRRCRNVRRAILLHANVYLRLVHHQIVKGNLPAAEGVNPQSRFDSVCREQRLCSRRLLPMDCQTPEGCSERKPVHRNALKFDLSPCSRLEATSQ